MTSRLAAVAVLVLSLTATAAPTGKDAAAPADETLALIPPKAIATVQINGLGRVQDRLDKLLKAAAPDRADQASRAVRDAIAEALAGGTPRPSGPTAASSSPSPTLRSCPTTRPSRSSSRSRAGTTSAPSS